eukprot:2028424-Pleurochrysis_carterae.AAC.1
MLSLRRRTALAIFSDRTVSGSCALAGSERWLGNPSDFVRVQHGSDRGAGGSGGSVRFSGKQAEQLSAASVAG